VEKVVVQDGVLIIQMMNLLLVEDVKMVGVMDILYPHIISEIDNFELRLKLHKLIKNGL